MKQVLIVGSNQNTAEKVGEILKEDAMITVVCPRTEIHENLLPFLNDGEVGWFNRTYHVKDLHRKGFHFLKG